MSCIQLYKRVVKFQYAEVCNQPRIIRPSTPSMPVQSKLHESAWSTTYSASQSEGLEPTSYDIYILCLPSLSHLYSRLFTEGLPFSPPRNTNRPCPLPWHRAFLWEGMIFFLCHASSGVVDRGMWEIAGPCSWLRSLSHIVWCLMTCLYILLYII